MRALSACVLGALFLSVAGVLVLGIVGTAPAAPPPGTVEVGELVVALRLPAPGLQAGALRGNRVVAARGLEVDVARAVARRLGAATVRFIDVPDGAALTGAGPKRWDLALAGIDVRAPGGVDLSTPYLDASPAVLMRPGLPRPRSLTDLRRRLLCAIPGSAGATAARRVHAAFATIAAADDAELIQLVATGRCDAAVREGPLLGTSLERLGARHGPIGGRIDTGAAFAIALPRGSELADGVDRALSRLRANGTLARIAERWLGFDPTRLRVLR